LGNGAGREGRLGIVLGGLALLGGCMTYAVDESWFFRPEPVGQWQANRCARGPARQ